MTIPEIRARVQRIADQAQRDPEGAHGDRDKLLEDAVRYMANPSFAPDAETPATVAVEVLRALDIELSWEGCA